MKVVKVYLRAMKDSWCGVFFNGEKGKWEHFDAETLEELEKKFTDLFGDNWVLYVV